MKFPKRNLKAKWTKELSAEVKAWHGLDGSWAYMIRCKKIYEDFFQK